ncbi:hypothetical protein JL721_2259 [Aureococcus anophagefferens]|nr:hypothetical protein JL721_2259 [Aureococcus anophagefferens]
MDEWRAVAIDTLAGWAAGVVCTVAFQPVDTVLTRQQYEARLEASRGADDATVPVVAGAWAATVAWVVGYPFDLLKTRIQGSPTPLSLTGAARDLLRREAAPGAVSAVAVLYRGLGLKLLRAVPSSGLNFLAYESAKRELEARWAV